MTLWHVQKLYSDDDPEYVVLPYDLLGSMKITRSFRATIKFWCNSRLNKTFAEELCEKRNKKLQVVGNR